MAKWEVDNPGKHADVTAALIGRALDTYRTHLLYSSFTEQRPAAVIVDLVQALAEQTARAEAAEAREKALLEESAKLAAWQCVFTDGKTGLVCDEGGGQFCAMQTRVAELTAKLDAGQVALTPFADAADSWPDDWPMTDRPMIYRDEAIEALKAAGLPFGYEQAVDAIRAAAHVDSAHIRADALREVKSYINAYAEELTDADELAREAAFDLCIETIDSLIATPATSPDVGALLMVENIDTISDLCRKHKVKEPSFRAILRALAAHEGGE